MGKAKKRKANPEIAEQSEISLNEDPQMLVAGHNEIYSKEDKRQKKNSHETRGSRKAKGKMLKEIDRMEPSEGQNKATFGEGDNIVEIEVQGTEFPSQGKISDNDSDISEEINQSEVEEQPRRESSEEGDNSDGLNESTVSETASVRCHQSSPRRRRKQRKN